MKNIVYTFLLLFISVLGFAQIPVEWDITSQKLNDKQYKIIYKAKIGKGWHLYSQFLKGDEGPIPTTFIYKDSSALQFIDNKEIGSETHYDEVWEAEISFFDNEAVFEQTIELVSPGTKEIEGEIEFMVCNESECMPPELIPFKVDLERGKKVEVIEEDFHTDENVLSVIPKVENVDLNNPVNKECGDSSNEEHKSYWMLFLLGLGGGLISLITPCVFPMIPLTVSFFTKGGSEKGKGVAKALLYGLSIVAVYVSLSLPFYATGTSPELLNEISTGFALNMFFFIIFIVFAASFFGYFEIGLPSSWANKADKAADLGGFIGVVFMAIVLAIVSFSCTGPLLGSVLAGSLKDGPVPITVAMLGFGIGIGFPFTLFAAFPSILKNLPQSGGWLNTVKVTLGFVELALALKFLSNAEYVYQSRVLLRETFFLIWIIIFFSTVLYLLGYIRFPHDPKEPKLSKLRKGIAGLFLLFAIYLLPGLLPEAQQWWKPTLVSGFPPATNYSWYDDQGTHHFLDFEEARAYAEEHNQKLLIDFTGYACVNCRKMEENVWTDEKVKELLEDFVIVSLYVDDKNPLPKELQGEIAIEYEGGVKKQKKIKTIGNKWATFEQLYFGQVSQPYYVQLSPKGYLLTHPVGYTEDPAVYAEWLECGIEANKKLEEGMEVAVSPKENNTVVAENISPITWNVSAEKLSDDTYEILIHGDLQDGWHAYSQYLESMEGPLPTLIEFEPNDQYELIDSTYEENTHSHYDETFEMEVTDFSNEAIFKQKVKVKNGNILVKGNINYMVCNDGKCLPPTDHPFEIELK